MTSAVVIPSTQRPSLHHLMNWPDEGRNGRSCRRTMRISERLYEGQGFNTQQLPGHSSDRMAAQYHNDRGLEWVKVKV
ncbi:hypothetical protein [Enterobacter sp. JMULE2]|uniref:hypothetical protein n=1 Tax=Enterobacter TaxID=547 RepID=UPI0020C87CB3|nr:hypothetical protein [Enterobacter sp. JMULE2]